jgi:hypothetical protein
LPSFMQQEGDRRYNWIPPGNSGFLDAGIGASKGQLCALVSTG